MKIGAVYLNDVPNVKYRTIGPLRALARRGHEIALVEQAPDSGAIDVDQLLGCDVVHVYRRADRHVLAAVDELRARGVAITWDNDDNVAAAPKESPYYRELGGIAGYRDFQQQKRMLMRADLVTTPSPVLADLYRRHGAGRVEVIENHLGGETFMRAGGRAHKGTVIGWVAGLEHRADVGRLRLVEALRELLASAPDVRVMTIGVRLGIDDRRYQHLDPVALERLPGYVRRWDVAIAPLADVPFNLTRSNVKLKEYAACGVPWLASNRGPYRNLGADEGGVLVDDDGWAAGLADLVADRRRRRRLRRNGVRWAKRETIDHHVGEWEQAFAAAVEARDGAVAAV